MFKKLIILCLCTAVRLFNIQYSDLGQMVFQNEIKTWLPQCKTTQIIINNISTMYTEITISLSQINILPSPYPATKMFVYGCDAINPITKQSLGYIQSAPGPTLKAFSGQYLTINFINNISSNHLFAVDYSLMMDPYFDINTDAIQGVPTTVHVHGQIIDSNSDGFPSSFTTFYGNKGPTYYSLIPTNNNSFIYQYPNLLYEATLFYHDHTTGFTRLNNYAGMSGMYLIESRNTSVLNIIDSQHDIILSLQDKTFNEDGSLWYYQSWQSQFYGDAIVVNGKIWPTMKIENGLYRLRILNACNSRFFNITFQYSNNSIIPFTVVKADSDYLDSSYNTNFLVLFVGERYELLINLTGNVGQQIYIISNLISAFDFYTPISPLTTKYILRFDIAYSYTGKFTIPLPIINLNRIMLENPIKIIQTIVIEYHSAYGVLLGSYIDGHPYNIKYNTFELDKVYELHLINLMIDPHPIHIHLARFQVIKRLGINNVEYSTNFIQLNGAMPYYNNKQKYLNITQYLTNSILPPNNYELADRDIIQSNPSEILIVRFRFSMPNGKSYPINVTGGYGFVLHCHILEHQDNSLMALFDLIQPIKSISSISSYNIQLIIGLSVAGCFIVTISIAILIYKRRRKNNKIQEKSSSIQKIQQQSNEKSIKRMKGLRYKQQESGDKNFLKVSVENAKQSTKKIQIQYTV